MAPVETYPRTVGDRAARRKRILDQEIHNARLRARSTETSYRCAIGDCAPDGCRNDGTGCLCECHDLPDGGPGKR
jgi:hypothetical protein